MIDFERWKRLAEEGDTYAIEKMVYAYANGHCVKKDLVKAEEWEAKLFEVLFKQAKKREWAAIRDGVGMHIEEWAKRAEKGDMDILRAMCQVAEAYRHGLGGLEQNEEKAKEWEARVRENKPYKNDLVPRDEAEAREWLAKRFATFWERAKAKDTTALRAMAWAYRCGWVVEIDLEKAVFLEAIAREIAE